MRYYSINNEDEIAISSYECLSHYYSDVYELPADYEKGKYIPADVEKTVEVPDYDEEGHIIGYHTETIIKRMLVFNSAWEQTEITRLKALLNEANTKGAKKAVEQGYVEFRDALFETNSQTVSDLTSAMLIMKESEMSVYPWLSMDDKYIELTLEDFGTLGSLIAGFKAQVWNTKYIGYKTQIALAQTIEELKEIEIEY